MRERKYAANLMALGAFIRQRRRDLGLTQGQLADRVGWVQERISLLEHGKYGTPSLPLLAGLADALEVDQATLLSAAGFLNSAGEPVPAFEVERHVMPDRAPTVDGREAVTADDLHQVRGKLASQVERLQVGLAAAESQMHQVDVLRAELASRRRLLSQLAEELQTAVRSAAS